MSQRYQMFSNLNSGGKGGSHSSAINWSLFLFGAVIGAVIAVVSVKYSDSPYQTRHITPSGFYLGVKITFPSNDDLIEFRDDFKGLAAYIRDKELGTISYELLQSDKNPLQLYALERYVDKKAYVDVHRQSEEFKAFRGRFQKLIDKGANVEGDSFNEMGVGFI